MEKKKNNAVEKAEKIARQNQSPSENGEKAIDKNVKKENANPKKSHSKKSRATKERKRQEARERARMIKKERAIQKQKIRAEKEKALAQKRIELAKIKAHKKAEKEKAKATALRDKNRKKAEIKERKARLKEERMARKEMLKNESKKEKANRIRLERIAKSEERERKRQAKLQRRKERQKRREKNRGYGGWLAAVISLGLATLVLASILTFSMLLPSTNDTMLESGYQKTFYDAVEQVDNMDINLSKALATKDSGAIQKYLLNTAINSELAESDIQNLPLSDEYKFYTAKLINQIGDYSKYIMNKLIDGEKLTSKDKENLTQLYQANLALKDALKNIMDGMDNNYSFASLEKEEKGDILLSGLSELQNLSVQYPELIYDGPFSDGQSRSEMKGLGQEEISMDMAKENFAKIFSDYSFNEISDVGETSGQIDCYNIQGINDDNILFAQMTKKGGKLIMFSFAGDCNKTEIEREKAIDIGLEFLKKQEIMDMKAVWTNLANNVYTINYAYQIDDTIIYPDMIKLRICAESGKVIGQEAKSYFANHVERTISEPTLSEKQAEEKLFEGIEIESIRLCLVPVGEKMEKLCYEFSGIYNNDTYYVYIDAISGRQVQMFKVIKGTEGTLLM